MKGSVSGLQGAQDIIKLPPLAVYAMKPAQVLEFSSEAVCEALPEPLFLLSLPAWHTVFLDNLVDLLRPGRETSLPLLSRPGSFWPDVFVASRLPWNRFVQSACGHIAVMAALWGAAQLWRERPRTFETPIRNRAQVLYYAGVEYLPPLDTGGARKSRPEKGDPAYARQPILSVPPEADNRTQTLVTPSALNLDHDLPLPNIVAWSQTQPAVPLASTARAGILRIPRLAVAVVAPAPETIPGRPRTSSLSPTAVAPAPEVDLESSTRAGQLSQAAVIAPPPRLVASSARRLGDINLGHAAVVAPATELPLPETYALAGGRRPAGFDDASTAVVPPAPSLPGAAGLNSGARLIALGIHPGVEAPAEVPAGNRRGTLAATPSGGAGGAGTPQVVGPTNPNPQGGSGSAKNGTGLPSGLSVGKAAAASRRPALAGQGQAQGMGSGNGGTAQSPERPSLIADASPPRVSRAPTRPASEVSEDQATDVDHWIFGDRKFYSMTLNMPNLNSAGGSWVIRFAELKGNESKEELTAPVATQKVDPAYPLELMRRNVQGTVTLYALIRNDGSVSDVRVLRGVDDRLDQYACSALAHWHFRPATKSGNAVELEAVVMIPFRPVRLKSSF